METVLITLALLAYIAWRERSHAVERRVLLSRRGVHTTSSAPAVSSRRREKGEVEPARVVSPIDDAAFNALKDGLAEAPESED